MDSSNPKIICLLLLLASCLFGQFAVAVEPGETTTDIRILVDISGSMKENDPNNLRIPAIKLLANMMPEGVEAGVWTFAKLANNLIKQGPVDDAWKASATKQAENISSIGLFTDIQYAMERLSRDWNTADGQQNRHLILLTDGMVDVSKKAEESKASRETIINELVPKLAAANVMIHTIALSESADRSLLEHMAITTGGHFAIVKDSQDLLKVFVNTFDEATEPEQLPMEGNKFHIDSSVEEFTALVYRVPDSPATQLRTPSGRVLSMDSSEPGMNWFNDPHYDLITIRDPEQGEWSLVADLDPDNRVTVVSDLNLEIEGIPSHIVVGEKLELTITLNDKGNVVVRPEFLSLIDLTFRQEYLDKGKMWEGKLTSHKQGVIRTPKDGKYSAKLGKTLLPGDHTFSVILDGKTFHRKKEKHLTVHKEVVESLIVEEQQEEPYYFLNIIPKGNLISTETANVSGLIISPQGNEKTVEAKPNTFGSWRIDVPPEDGPGDYRVLLTVTGKTTRGVDLDLQQQPVFVSYGGTPISPPPDPEEETIAEESPQTSEIEEEELMGEEESEEVEPEAQDKPEENQTDMGSGIDDGFEDDFDEEESLGQDSDSGIDEVSVEPMEEESELGFYLLIAAIVVGNLVFFGGGFFLIRKLMKKGAQEEENTLGDIDQSLEKAKKNVEKQQGGKKKKNEDKAKMNRDDFEDMETVASPGSLPGDEDMSLETDMDDLEAALEEAGEDIGGIDISDTSDLEDKPK